MSISFKRFAPAAAPITALVAALALLALSGCGQPVDDAPAAPDGADQTGAGQAPIDPDGAGPTEIAWRDGDVQDAFAEAAELNKPVLLYWGAVWCPPCNRLRAGLFQEPDFVARTRDFVPVYLDGDSRGAQAWGARFGIRGYPTLIILNPDRSEITRLSGGGDPEQVEAVLAAAQSGGGDARQILNRALTEPSRLSSQDWTLLAEFGWSVDADRLVESGEAADALERLSQAAPTPALQRRFALAALAQRPSDAPPLDPARQAETRALLEAVLASPAEVRANRGALVYSGADLVRAAGTDEAEREAMAGALIAALDRLYDDESLGTSDRLSTVHADIALFRARHGADAEPPQALRDKVRERAEWADETADTPYERQSVISTAASLLNRVGEAEEAERLLTAELDRSQTPYYYMPALAGLAEARGDRAQAVDWLRQGYETSGGPATRVQWGVLYVQGLIRLTPEDGEAVENAAGAVIDELSEQPDSYHQRTRQRFETLGQALGDWSRANDETARLERLNDRIANACAAQTDPEALTACRSWLTPV